MQADKGDLRWLQDVPPSGRPGACTATYRPLTEWPGGLQGEGVATGNATTSFGFVATPPSSLTRPRP
jgi:hypothetical protein